MTSIGTVDFPAPRSTDDMQCEYASRQKKNAAM